MDIKVFFSFEYSDIWRATVVRSSWLTIGKVATGFADVAEIEDITRQGHAALKHWINSQLKNTSVTVVLVGRHTCSSQLVKYGIEKSIERGNELLGIDISKIKDLKGKTTSRCGHVPKDYPFYLWNKDDGDINIDDWIERAAKVSENSRKIEKTTI